MEMTLADPDKVGIYQRLQQTLGRIAKHRVPLGIKEAELQETGSLKLLSGSGLRISLLRLGFGSAPARFLKMSPALSVQRAHGCLGTTLIFQSCWSSLFMPSSKKTDYTRCGPGILIW